jgi:hypothetical protein
VVWVGYVDHRATLASDVDGALKIRIVGDDQCQLKATAGVPNEVGSQVDISSLLLVDDRFSDLVGRPFEAHLLLALGESPLDYLYAGGE